MLQLHMRLVETADSYRHVYGPFLVKLPRTVKIILKKNVQFFKKKILNVVYIMCSNVYMKLQSMSLTVSWGIKRLKLSQ